MPLSAADFPPCPVCAVAAWSEVRTGPVRDGVFGRVRDAAVARCGSCGIERLAESACIPDGHYASASYREKLEQELDSQSYWRNHDGQQIFALSQLLPEELRGRVVADIGCAGGSFLDHVSGLAREIIAVEPAPCYQASLAGRGYHVYGWPQDAAAARPGSVDLAVSLQVIEHTADPRAFLSAIRPLLAPGGVLLISTPNRADILRSLLPEDFDMFFYRVVHRWYFDVASLAACAKAAGYGAAKPTFVHRYGMSNALSWLRDRRPTGHARLSQIDGLADAQWKGWLEDRGLADCLCMRLEAESPTEPTNRETTDVRVSPKRLT